MERVADELRWSGADVMLSMFVVSESGSPLDTLVWSLEPVPTQTHTYVLEDEGNVLSGRSVIEYDFTYAEAPKNLEALLSQCLHAARAAGADIAWFGFEASFNYGHLLTRETAKQIYAVMDSEGIEIATDATRFSHAWAERVVRTRERLRPRTSSLDL